MPTIAEALDAAVKFHRDGDLERAERLYWEVVHADARNADAWHLLGLVAQAKRQFACALEYIGRAVQLDGTEPSFHDHLAEVYRALGQLSDAEACSRRAISLQEDFAGAHNRLGMILAEQGRFHEAAASYRRALAQQQNFTQAQFNLGAALHSLGQCAQAVDCYRRAIECDRGFAMAYNNLGAVLCEMGSADDAIVAYREALRINPRQALVENNLGRILHAQSKLPEAIACYRRALAIEPGDAKAHCNLGGALVEIGQTSQAIECFRRAIEADRNLAEAHFNLGVIFQGQGQLAEATECYQNAIRAKPDCVPAHNNLGTLYKRQNKLEEAIGCYERALEFRPDFAEVLNNLGNVFKVQGRIAEAAICYDQTLRIKPDFLQARCNRALMDLAAGDFAAGWPDYEWRCEFPDFPKRTFAEPKWQGEPLAGRTLLVYAEQGLGDTLQFIRYVPLLERLGGTLIVEVAAPLVPLLQQSGLARSARLVPKGAALPRFDVQVSLLSLPGILGTTLETIPNRVPYLSADPRLVDQWRGALAPTSGLKVGIAWQGSTTYAADHFRSIPLAHFAPLAQEGVELVSLQIGRGSEQLSEIAGRFPVLDLGERLDRAQGAFMDTAAIMQCLDLVVTSDTAIAHLAGALAVKVWVALPLSPDWRWLREREDSPWYPSMRLFRQTRFDDWPPVFARMAEELARFSRRAAPAS